MISHARNLEDAVLARAFKGRRTGFYIDVGASDPNVGSVTKHFYDSGWSGVNVGPSTPVSDLFERERPRDINLRYAIGERDGGALQLAQRDGHELPHARGESLALRMICERHAAVRPIQFLRIGVGGREKQVIASGDWRRFRPEVLIVEATTPVLRSPNHEPWEALLLEEGYVFAHFDGLNRFYAAGEHLGLRDKLDGPPDHLLEGLRLAREVALQDRADASDRSALAQREAVDRITFERDACRQELFESSRVIAHLARERQILDAQIRSEIEAREALTSQVEAEVQAREALATQLKAEVQARETLAAQVGAEVRAREALAAQVGAEARAREALAAQLGAEVESREKLMSQVAAEVEAREALQVQLRQERDLRLTLESRIAPFERERATDAASPADPEPGPI